jgi:type I restriction enzyme S subunit
MKYPAYSEYKDSGVQWLGDVPKHWAVKRGRFVMKVNPPSLCLRQLSEDSEVSFVPMEAVGQLGGIQLGQNVCKADVSGGYTEFQNGDVVFAKITPCFENEKGALAENLKNGAAYGTTELHVLRCSTSLDRRYLFYLSITDLFRKLGESEMYGAGGQKRVPPEFCKDFRTPLPPLAEQKAIAEFLDRETGRIDALVEKKRQLVERLKEKRAALISRTVTKGLPPEAARAAGLEPHTKLVFSGNDWLGEVPEQWAVRRIKEICTLVGRIGFRGYSVDDLVSENEGAISMSPSNMVDGLVNLDKCTWLSWEKYYESPEIQIKAKDVIMVKTGSTIGKTAFVECVETPMTINPQLMIFKEVKCNERFLFYYLISKIIQDVIPLHNTGSTIPTMTQEGIGKLPVPYPDLVEQTAIAEYLDWETAKLDQLSKNVGDVIERLQEYRSALITAAVTGKVDVRGEVGEVV